MKLKKKLTSLRRKLAREAADEWTAKTTKPRYVAGVLGPTTVLVLFLPMNDPGYRSCRHF